MPDALVNEDRFWTYRDYKEWDLKEGERYEIIYGEAYAMAALTDKHQAIVAVLTAKFYNFLRESPAKSVLPLMTCGFFMRKTKVTIRWSSRT
jgi:Uma2 family endonuclease